MEKMSEPNLSDTIDIRMLNLDIYDESYQCVTDCSLKQNGFSLDAYNKCLVF